MWQEDQLNEQMVQFTKVKDNWEEIGLWERSIKNSILNIGNLEWILDIQKDVGQATRYISLVFNEESSVVVGDIKLQSFCLKQCVWMRSPWRGM